MKHKPVKKIEVVPPDILEVCGLPPEKKLTWETWVHPIAELLRKQRESLCYHCAEAPICMTQKRLYTAALGGAFNKRGGLKLDARHVGILVTECQDWKEYNWLEENGTK